MILHPLVFPDGCFPPKFKSPIKSHSFCRTCKLLLSRNEFLEIFRSISFLCLPHLCCSHQLFFSPGANPIKLSDKLCNLLIFAGNAGAYTSGARGGGHKRLSVTNGVTYYSTELITPIKRFTMQASGANPIKLFKAVIYGFL
jgi:hypothetical protein